MKTIVARDCMLTSMPVIVSGTQVSEVVDILLANQITGLPVVNENKEIIGFVSEQDCLKPLLVSSYHREAEKVVNDVMSTDVTSVEGGDALLDLAKKMIELRPKVYPVVEKGKLIGVLTRKNVLAAIVNVQT